MSLENLLSSIRGRLEEGAYQNEAAVSVGVVLPVLRKLGWDDSDPGQIVPEYPMPGGRVDFALFGSVRQPSVFIEVKGVGRLYTGDKQLFEYAFHKGVPICLLTDGREWSFYYPPGEGDYSERRVRKLDFFERAPHELADTLERYLGRERVRTGAARDAVDLDFRDLRSRREAQRSIPTAWGALVREPEELLIELLQDQTESISGVRPSSAAVLSFLQSLSSSGQVQVEAKRDRGSAPVSQPTPLDASPPPYVTERVPNPKPEEGRQIAYTFLGDARLAKSGNAAFVDILRGLAERHPQRIDEIAKRARGRSRNHIARTPEEIYPKRPDLARAEEFYPGWLVGLNIANREKSRIIRAACDVLGLEFGKDIKIDLPNA